MTTPTPSPLPLDGVRVLDMTRLLPGNLCTLALAMLGADVIKVEDTGDGDYQRDFGVQVAGAGAAHHIVNRAKRSIALNLKQPADRARFDELVRTASILVESFRPGTLDRLGYSLDRLHELRSNLVVASISGYGATSPMSGSAGHDINYLAFSGILHRLGRSGSRALPPLPLADLVGGGLVPAMMIIGYLRRAEADGRGCWIDAAMTDGIALLPHVLLADVVAGGPAPGPGESLLDGGLACYDRYATIAGEIVVGALEARFWDVACDVVGGLDEYRADHWNPSAQHAIRRRLTEFFAALTRDEVVARFADRDGCVSPVLSYEEMLQSPHAAARKYLIDSPAMPVLAFPAMVDGALLPEHGPAPTQGQHSSELLPEQPLTSGE